MVLCFLLLCYRQSWQEYLGSFLASVFYLHNFFWPRGVLPLVNPVAWSLEIEVQFYVIAPLVALIFKAERRWRRGLLAVLILLKLMTGWTFQLPHVSLIDFYEFFLIGFLLADLYVHGQLETSPRKGMALWGALLAFAGIWMVPDAWLPLVLGLFVTASFKSHSIRLVLGNRWITAVGGMCYSIYLLHWIVITTLGGRVIFRITGSPAIDFAIHAMVLMGLILAAGAVLFKWVEQPCMARDWPRRLMARLRLGSKPVS